MKDDKDPYCEFWFKLLCGLSGVNFSFEEIRFCNSRHVYREEKYRSIMQYDSTHVPDNTVSRHNSTKYCKAKLQYVSAVNHEDVLGEMLHAVSVLALAGGAMLGSLS